jgi:hypothetical protein
MDMGWYHSADKPSDKPIYKDIKVICISRVARRPLFTWILFWNEIVTFSHQSELYYYYHYIVIICVCFYTFLYYSALFAHVRGYIVWRELSIHTAGGQATQHLINLIRLYYTLMSVMSYPGVLRRVYFPQVEWKSLLRSRCGYIGGWGGGNW